MKTIFRWLGWHIHEWNNWERIQWQREDGAIVDRQKRICATCGRIQVEALNS